MLWIIHVCGNISKRRFHRGWKESSLFPIGCMKFADDTVTDISGDYVERVHTFKFWGTLISADHFWTVNTTAVIKKPEQQLHFLRILKENNMGEKLLVTHCLNIETVLIYCVSVWWSHYSEVDKKRLQRVSQTAPSLPEGHFSLPLAELRTSSRMAPILTFICSTSHIYMDKGIIESFYYSLTHTPFLSSQLCGIYSIYIIYAVNVIHTLY